MILIESQQLEGTPSENIKHFEEEGNKVKAIFWTPEDAANYIRQYSSFALSSSWHDRVGFADFYLNGNEVHAISTYHPTNRLIEMLENGLKL